MRRKGQKFLLVEIEARHSSWCGGAQGRRRVVGPMGSLFDPLMRRSDRQDFDTVLDGLVGKAEAIGQL